jgi:hypothetical protein
MDEHKRIIGLNFYGKNFNILAHVSVWLVLMLLPYIMHSYHVAPIQIYNAEVITDFMKLDYVGYFFWIVVFYFNTTILIPKLFMNGRYSYYSLALLGIYVLYLMVHYYVYLYLEIEVPYSLPRAIWSKLPAFFLTIASGLAYYTIKDLIRYREKLRQSEHEKLKAELSFLRSQINPHFIFNILNNIAAMVRLNSSELEPTVMKLSGLMKYMLYHTDDEKVSIQTEEEYLNHYIALQKQRFGKKVRIESNFNISHTSQLIEPMLLIPFIENAFKHGTGAVEDPFITIELFTDDQFLNFNVVNKFAPEPEEQPLNSSGIGIANVRRRIDVLYENRNQLTIKNNNNLFEVNLLLKFGAQ